MEQSLGFVAQGEMGKVCRLRKSLYSLKQSPRAWFGKFSQVVEAFGMQKSMWMILASLGATLKVYYLLNSFFIVSFTQRI